MSFTITKEDLKRSQKCPPGMKLATLKVVEDEYYNENGTSIQKCEFETDDGYTVPKWFNDKFISDITEFVQAADNVTFSTENFEDIPIELKDYIGKRVAISISHTKDKNNKIQAQIDNFFTVSKVPF